MILLNRVILGGIIVLLNLSLLRHIHVLVPVCRVHMMSKENQTN